MVRIETLISCLFVWLSFGLASAVACSCPRPPENVTGDDQYRAWTLERATDVVRGRIIDVRAGQHTVRGGQRVVVARMSVNSVVKGDLAVGDLTILTMFGVGDCGIASWLLAGIAWDRDMTLEVRRVPDLPNEYVVDMCGYGTMAPMIPPKR